jgi:hypothetical protein
MLVDDVTAADPSLTQLTQPTDSGNASALSSTLQVMAKLQKLAEFSSHDRRARQNSARADASGLSGDDAG